MVGWEHDVWEVGCRKEGQHREVAGRERLEVSIAFEGVPEQVEPYDRVEEDEGENGDQDGEWWLAIFAGLLDVLAHRSKEVDHDSGSE